MSVYADSSFFVSLYLRDAHFAEARRRIGTQHRIWLTPLHRVEWSHAVAQHVFRRVVSGEDAARVSYDFEADRARGLWVEVEMPARAFDIAVGFAKKHVEQLGGRTLDSLHVASALELAADEFWTFDDRQAKLARAVGLKGS